MKNKPMAPATPDDQPDGLVPRLRFPEFRDAGGWEQKKLHEICEVMQGFGFPEIMQGKSSGRYPFCKVSDVSRAVAEKNGILDLAANYVNEEDLPKLKARVIPCGSTVFAKIGEALRLNRRSLITLECIIDNNLVALNPYKNIINNYFLFFASCNIDLNDYCGGAVPSVNKSTLQEIQIAVPSLEEQKKIADCLTSLDVLIRAENRKLDLLKTHKKALMQQLFPRDGETVPTLRFPEFQDVGEWEGFALSEFIKSLDTGVSVNSGDRPANSREIGILKTSCVGNDKFDILENKVVTDAKEITRVKENVQKNTIIISRMNTPALVGANAYVDSDHKNIYLPDRLWAAKSGERGSMKFIAYVLGSQKGRMALSELATGTSGSMKNITKTLLLDLYIFAPDDLEQQKIADCLSALDRLIQAQSRKLDVLKTHKKALMQQLFPVLDDGAA